MTINTENIEQICDRNEGVCDVSIGTKYGLYHHAQHLVCDWSESFEQSLFEIYPRLKNFSKSSERLDMIHLTEAIQENNIFLFRAMIYFRPDLIRKIHLSAAISLNNFLATADLMNSDVDLTGHHGLLDLVGAGWAVREVFKKTSPLLAEAIEQSIDTGSHDSLSLQLANESSVFSYVDFLSFVGRAHRGEVYTEVIERLFLEGKNYCRFSPDIFRAIRVMREIRDAMNVKGGSQAVIAMVMESESEQPGAIRSLYNEEVLTQVHNTVTRFCGDSMTRPDDRSKLVRTWNVSSGRRTQHLDFVATIFPLRDIPMTFGFQLLPTQMGRLKTLGDFTNSTQFDMSLSSAAFCAMVALTLLVALMKRLVVGGGGRALGVAPAGAAGVGRFFVPPARRGGGRGVAPYVSHSSPAA